MKAEAWRRKEYNKRRDLVLKTSGTRKAVFVSQPVCLENYFHVIIFSILEEFFFIFLFLHWDISQHEAWV